MLCEHSRGPLQPGTLGGDSTQRALAWPRGCLASSGSLRGQLWARSPWWEHSVSLEEPNVFSQALSKSAPAQRAGTGEEGLGIRILDSLLGDFGPPGRRLCVLSNLHGSSLAELKQM